jgi:lipopolysaccharide export system protein LptA
MPVTTARLRIWIVLATGLLVVAIAGFFIYGRWQGRHFTGDLPDGLNSGIQQSTNGFTYSESRGGHTIYTLHAARAVQFKTTGHAELHDVSITLYGSQGSAANRIYGSNFDWDPVNGVARALGEVQIDFQGSASGAPSPESGGKNMVHVKTSGLVFNKKTGVASTTEKIEFHLAQAAGSATGANFDSQTGVMVLIADVAFNSSANGNPLAVHARHAQYDRASRLLYLVQDVTDYADSHSSSDQATVAFRTDGSAYQVEAEGNVILTGSDGQRVNTRKAHIDLGPKSEPQRALLDGGVLYVSDTAARLLHGSASQATLLLAGAQATIQHAQLRDAVSVVDEEKLPPVSSSAAKSKRNPPESTTRQVGATKVDIDFVSGPDHRPMAQHILATGGARLNVHTLYAQTPPEDSTIQGDQLFATLTDGEVLSSLRGTGHTNLILVSPDGRKQTSTGDNLLMTFAPPPAKAKGEGQPAAQLQSAVQAGNVTLRQESPAPEQPATAAPAVSTATAQRADYNATTQVVQLSGDPRIHDANGELSAAAVEFERLNGNANATGGVKATYRQATGQQQGMSFAGSGPVHVVADHAHLDHATDVTTFFGLPGAPARLWQASDSVTAPVLEISRTHGTLAAHGPAGEKAAVNAVFTSAPNPKSAHAEQTSVVRLQSRTLLYAENDHKAVFSGGVAAQTSAGLLHSSIMDVYFTPTQGKPSDRQGSQVSKIVARGGVQLEQPGRKGTGEELTYTADDSQYVLTGSNAAPPRLNDQARGSVTGNALIFNDRDDSVIVKGGDSQAVTQTRVAR